MAAVKNLRFAAAAALYILVKRRARRQNRWRNRKMWAKSWIMRRKNRGVYDTLVQELATEDTAMFRSYMRMLPEHFHAILEIIRPKIIRQNTVMRDAISPEQRLAITLRFLATGESFRSLSFAYRMGRSTASAIVKETCAAIYDGLKDAYLKVPNTAQEWKKISQEFQQKWNYSFCVGALDGKHIRIKNPESAGSLYYNYKKFYSIVLLALVDAGYRFIYVDIGAPGHNGDAGIYDNCTLKVAIENKLLNLPDPEIIPGTEKTFCHYHIIGEHYETLLPP